MPQLNWNENDFLECFEVLPKVEEYEVEFVYEIEKNGLVLIVSVRQFESVVGVSVRQRELATSITEFALFVRDGVEYIHDKRGDYLEFRDCIVAANRFSYLKMGDLFDTAQFNCGLNIQIAVKSNIEIRHVRN